MWRPLLIGCGRGGQENGAIRDYTDVPLPRQALGTEQTINVGAGTLGIFAKHMEN